MRIGYHASHEQFAASELLALTRLAQESGFGAASCSDHIRPWSERQGHGGHSWTWLGAALQATAFPIGVVAAPGYRYHPAVMAQAAATLTGMFPGRFWLAVGSGELLNEAVLGQRWPAKPERNARLKECAEIMRALWAGETVTRNGLVRVEEARLHGLSEPPALLAAALTPETAEWAGGWADGLITVSRPREELARVVEAFHRGGGRGKPLFLKAQVSYAPTEEEALRGAWEQWRTNIFQSDLLADLRSPAQFESAAAFVTAEDMRGHVRVSADPLMHVRWLAEDLDMGFSRVLVHNVNQGQERFIRDFGAKVLPALGGSRD